MLIHQTGFSVEKSFDAAKIHLGAHEFRVVPPHAAQLVLIHEVRAGDAVCMLRFPL